jgi:hypothetical protein
MIGVRVDRRNSHDVVAATMGQGGEADRPSDGKIKAARRAAGGRPERGQ